MGKALMVTTPTFFILKELRVSEGGRYVGWACLQIPDGFGTSFTMTEGSSLEAHPKAYSSCPDGEARRGSSWKPSFTERRKKKLMREELEKRRLGNLIKNEK